MKSFTLDGKRHRLDSRVPTQQVQWLVDRQHVGTSDLEITELIDGRTHSWPAAARKSARTFAVYCHRKNQHLVERFRL